MQKNLVYHNSDTSKTALIENGDNTFAAYRRNIDCCRASNALRSKPWPFTTWRHRLYDYSIRHMPFSIGGPFELNVYLQPFSTYSAVRISGSSWPWPFGDMWRHQSGDYSICHRTFPMGGPLWRSPYFYRFSRYSVRTSGTCWFVIAHAQYHVICTHVQNLSTYINLSPQFSYTQITFIGLQWRI